jgi:hypothetical protein
MSWGAALAEPGTNKAREMRRKMIFFMAVSGRDKNTIRPQYSYVHANSANILNSLL